MITSGTWNLAGNITFYLCMGVSQIKVGKIPFQFYTGVSWEREEEGYGEGEG